VKGQLADHIAHRGAANCRPQPLAAKLSETKTAAIAETIEASFTSRAGGKPLESRRLKNHLFRAAMRR
jgi:hypothetical protein